MNSGLYGFYDEAKRQLTIAIEKCCFFEPDSYMWIIGSKLVDKYCSPKNYHFIYQKYDGHDDQATLFGIKVQVDHNNPEEITLYKKVETI